MPLARRARRPQSEVSSWVSSGFVKAILVHRLGRQQRENRHAHVSGDENRALRLIRNQSPCPGSGEKNFWNFSGTPSNSSASAGGSRLTVMLGHCVAYSALSLSHFS